MFDEAFLNKTLLFFEEVVIDIINSDDEIKSIHLISPTEPMLEAIFHSPGKHSWLWSCVAIPMYIDLDGLNPKLTIKSKQGCVLTYPIHL